jgi:two-component system response regulator MprA
MSLATVQRWRLAPGLACDFLAREDSRRLASSPCSVLLVERDPHVRVLAAHYLVAAGHLVRFAADGQEALAMVAIEVPRLVITEILVPRLDGPALCRHLKANPGTAHVRVLVLSILAAGARAKEAGADGFLLKPLSEHRLIAMVHDLVEQRSQSLQHVEERS